MNERCFKTGLETKEIGKRECFGWWDKVRVGRK